MGVVGQFDNSFKGMVGFVKNYLKPEERATLERALGSQSVNVMLRDYYKDKPGALRALDTGATGLESRIALAYMAWTNGAFNVGPAGQSVFFSIADDAKRLMRVVSDSDVAQRMFTDIQLGRIKVIRDAQLNGLSPPQNRPRRAQTIALPLSAVAR